MRSLTEKENLLILPPKIPFVYPQLHVDNVCIIRSVVFFSITVVSFTMTTEYQQELSWLKFIYLSAHLVENHGIKAHRTLKLTLIRLAHSRDCGESWVPFPQRTLC